MDNISRIVEVLTSDRFKGRRFDSEAGERAAHWLAQYLDQIEVAAPTQGRIQSQGHIQNVYGFIAGSDADETIVVGAHYDHLGEKFGRIYPGADDNASGVAVVLEIARLFTQNPIKTRRNILFAFFDGEESGQLGSRVYLSELKGSQGDDLNRHGQPVFMVNFDMVGRLKKAVLILSGFELSPLLPAWVDQSIKHSPSLSIKRKKVPQLHSDHAMFMAHGIPVLRFYTGYHADYHRSSDTADKLNIQGIKRIAEFGFEVVKRAATEHMDLKQYVTPNSTIAKYATYQMGIKQRQIP